MLRSRDKFNRRDTKPKAARSGGLFANCLWNN